MATRIKARKNADANVVAFAVLQASIGNAPVETPDSRDASTMAKHRNRAAKGGKARAKKLPKKRRAAIAKKAAQARWRKPRE